MIDFKHRVRLGPDLRPAFQITALTAAAASFLARFAPKTPFRKMAPLIRMPRTPSTALDNFQFLDQSLIAFTQRSRTAHFAMVEAAASFAQPRIANARRLIAAALVHLRQGKVAAAAMRA